MAIVMQKFCFKKVTLASKIALVKVLKDSNPMIITKKIKIPQSQIKFIN